MIVKWLQQNHPGILENGRVEKHNGVKGKMMKKILSDVKWSLDVGLGWCLSAKNSLLNSNGYIPNQLMLGYNFFPSILDN